METIAEIKVRIIEAAEKLRLDPDQLMRNYGVTTALAEMLEEEINKEVKAQCQS